MIGMRGDGMKRYCINSAPDRAAILEIVSEGAEGFQVRIRRTDASGYSETEESFLSYEILEMCVRTAYLTKITAVESAASSVA